MTALEDPTKRRVHYFPASLIDAVEEEAKRRLIEANKVGTRLIGSVSRDIICISLVLGKSLNEIRQMTKEEFRKACKQAKL